MIRKSKLNSCAHCPCRENLHVVFTKPERKMYFICSTHKVLLDALVEASARVGISL